MSLAAKLVLAIALLVAGFAGGIKWHVGIVAERDLEAQETRREKERADRKSIDMAAVGHEKDKAQIQTEFVTITETVERIVREPFYTAPDAPACLDDSGLQQLRAAIGSAPAASIAAPAVQGLKPTHWWQPKRDAEVVR